MPATNSWKGTGPSKMHTLAMFRGSSFRSRYRKAASMADMLDAPAGLLMTRPMGLRKQITVANTTGTLKAAREAVIRITPPGDERPLFVTIVCEWFGAGRGFKTQLQAAPPPRWTRREPPVVLPLGQQVGEQVRVDPVRREPPTHALRNIEIKSSPDANKPCGIRLMSLGNGHSKRWEQL